MLNLNIDTVIQNQSLSIGGLTQSYNRTKIEYLCGAAKNYLQAAKLYNMTSFVGLKNGVGSLSTLDDINKPFIEDDKYITLDEAKRLFIPKVAEVNGSANKYLKYNEEGKISFVDIEEE